MGSPNCKGSWNRLELNDVVMYLGPPEGYGCESMRCYSCCMPTWYRKGVGLSQHICFYGQIAFAASCQKVTLHFFTVLWQIVGCIMSLRPRYIKSRALKLEKK